MGRLRRNVAAVTFCALTLILTTVQPARCKINDRPAGRAHQYLWAGQPGYSGQLGKTRQALRST